MRVSYIEYAPLPVPAAYSVHTLSMADAMGAAGHDVTLLAPTHAGRVRTSSELGQLHRDLGLRGAFRLRYLPAPGPLPHPYFCLAVAAARLGRADLVFTRNPRIAQFASWLGLRVLIEWHDPPKTPRALRAARALCADRNVIRWVFVSERLRQITAEDLDLPHEKCVVAHNGISAALYAAPVEAGVARRALGLPQDRSVLVHCGHMYEGRGVELLLDVASAIPRLLLVLVGGQERDIARVRREVEARGLINVVLAGHRPVCEVPRYLAAADVLVMPFTADALTVDRRTRASEFASPMKTFEYLAAGRPIVAARFPAVSEVLTDGKNAVLVEPGSSDALHRAISGLLAAPARAAALAAQARRDAERFTWAKRTERILAGL